MAKLAPHQERDIEHPEATDLYVYGVNHETNKIVETEDLLKAFSDNSQAINAYLDNFKIRRIQEVSVQEKISQMGTTEIAIIALSSVIFLGRRPGNSPSVLFLSETETEETSNFVGTTKDVQYKKSLNGEGSRKSLR
ncbi:uncharacterized protein LOC106472750 [Limulus polyphemus]|uniref:Uncharacterized protein LOC106472750 n=1 Tax=Limulus polyphemus TaxID=6850 RepID=A0ABM1BUE9_LIMPO|nr:uncharacterized protein LOC106472750 [Limulus polyphemus]